MNNDPLQQLLGALREINWQLHEINRKLDSLSLPAAPAAPAPKAEAIAWFRAHFVSKEKGDLDRFLNQLPLYPSAEDLDDFLFPYCVKGNIKLRDFCTTVCATHLLALVKMDRKIGVEQFRRTLSDHLRTSCEIYRHRQRNQEASSSN